MPFGKRRPAVNKRKIREAHKLEDIMSDISIISTMANIGISYIDTSDDVDMGYMRVRLAHIERLASRVLRKVSHSDYKPYYFEDHNESKMVTKKPQG